MINAERHKLLGSYKTPRFRYGQTVECEVRGELQLVGLTDAPIPWPIGINQPGDGSTRNSSLVVFRGLAKAVRRESAIAIQHWWGVAPCTVRKWRRALRVPGNNEGTLARRSAASSTKRFLRKVIPAVVAKARDPERRAKIAAAKRGKKRPPQVIEALRRANIGRKQSAEERQKRSESHRHRGTRPPKAGRPWTAEEDNLLRALSIKEAAKRTGRTISACKNRRLTLGLPDGRRRRR